MAHFGCSGSLIYDASVGYNFNTLVESGLLIDDRYDSETVNCILHIFDRDIFYYTSQYFRRNHSHNFMNVINGYTTPFLIFHNFNLYMVVATENIMYRVKQLSLDNPYGANESGVIYLRNSNSLVNSTNYIFSNIHTDDERHDTFDTREMFVPTEEENDNILIDSPRFESSRISENVPSRTLRGTLPIIDDTFPYHPSEEELDDFEIYYRRKSPSCRNYYPIAIGYMADRFLNIINTNMSQIGIE